MRKKKDVILDFTSLLDVTLIILFFFIIFSYMKNDEVQKKANTAISEAHTISENADEKMKQAEKKLKEAEILEEQAKKELENFKDSSKLSGANYEAIKEFGKSSNITMKMSVSDEGRSIDIALKKGEKDIELILSENTPNADISSELSDVFEKYGYSASDTILCSFIYDSSEKGTYSAYSAVEKAFSALRKKYRYLYISEIDESDYRKDVYNG